MTVDEKMREFKKTEKVKMRAEINEMVERVKSSKFAAYSEKLETIRERKIEIKKRYKKKEDDYLNKVVRPKSLKTPLTQTQIQKLYRDRLKAERTRQKDVAEALAREFKGVSYENLLKNLASNANLAKDPKKIRNLSNAAKIVEHLKLNFDFNFELNTARKNAEVYFRKKPILLNQ